MSRSYDEPPREQRRSRRHRDAYRDTYRDAYRGAYRTPEEEFPRSSRAYEPGPESEPRRRGLNEDYYNPPPEEYNPDPPRRSRRGRSLRRSGERYEESLEDKYSTSQPKPPRRAKTQSHSRRHKKYESDFSDDEEPPARPAKPSRRKSFLEKIGLGKADNDKEAAARGRYDGKDRTRYNDKHGDRHYDNGKERHRGRSSRRSYTRSPSYSPPRRRNTTQANPVNKPGHGAAGGLKRTLTNANWQRAAGQAFRAGATAMYELRHDQSPWLGPKGVKVATAALGAGVMDAFTDEKRHLTRTRSGGMRQRAITRVGEAALRHLVIGRDRGRGKY